MNKDSITYIILSTMPGANEDFEVSWVPMARRIANKFNVIGTDGYKEFCIVVAITISILQELGLVEYIEINAGANFRRTSMGEEFLRGN